MPRYPVQRAASPVVGRAKGSLGASDYRRGSSLPPLRRQAPYRGGGGPPRLTLPPLEKKAQERAARRLGLKIIGKAGSRLVPFLGWGLLALDLWDLYDDLTPGTITVPNPIPAGVVPDPTYWRVYRQCNDPGSWPEDRIQFADGGCTTSCGAAPSGGTSGGYVPGTTTTITTWYNQFDRPGVGCDDLWYRVPVRRWRRQTGAPVPTPWQPPAPDITIPVAPPGPIVFPPVSPIAFPPAFQPGPVPIGRPGPGEEPSAPEWADPQPNPTPDWANPTRPSPRPSRPRWPRPGRPSVQNPIPPDYVVPPVAPVVQVPPDLIVVPPGTTVDFPPGKPPVIRPPKTSNPTRPPRPSKPTKEKKLHVATVGGLVWTGINTATEVLDFIVAMHKSLPKDKQLSAKASKAQVIEYMTTNLFDLYDDIIFSEALENYINMQVGDWAAALGSNPIKKVSQLANSTTGLDRAIREHGDMLNDARNDADHAPVESWVPELEIDVETGSVFISLPWGLGNIGIDNLSRR